MLWHKGPSCEFEASLLRGTASLALVALGAGADHIGPGSFTSTGTREDVVKTKLVGREPAPTILTAVLVPGKDVPSIEFYPHLGTLS